MGCYSVSGVVPHRHFAPAPPQGPGFRRRFLCIRPGWMFSTRYYRYVGNSGIVLTKTPSNSVPTVSDCFCLLHELLPTPDHMSVSSEASDSHTGDLCGIVCRAGVRVVLTDAARPEPRGERWLAKPASCLDLVIELVRNLTNLHPLFRRQLLARVKRTLMDVSYGHAL